ncbi:MAG: hypothetical protein HQM00_14225 [Magnetococcales bacterium]|nr:hypothetical protein [Magnetococcales bacterium]
MADYFPSQPPTGGDVRIALAWVYMQLTGVAARMREGSDTMQLTVLHAPPAKFSDGTVVFADGTDWNPGSGRGMYCYENGGWSKK